MPPLVPVPPNTFHEALHAASSVITTRVEIYESDGTTVWRPSAELGLLEGTVTVSLGDAERRTIEVVLENIDGSLLPSPAEEDLWYDKIIKAYYGVVTEDGVIEAQVGEFLIDSLSQPAFPDELTISGRDYVKRLQKDSFDSATSFAPTLSLEAVVRAIATNGGITKFLLPVTGLTLGATFSFESGTERWQAIYDIVTAFNYEVYFDVAGFLTLRPQQDPTYGTVVCRIWSGIDGNLITYTRVTNDTNLFNKIRVIAERSNQLPIVAIAENTNPSSPSRVERIGRRTKEFKSQFITTLAQAQALADQMLSVYSLESFELALEAIVHPWHDVGEVIEVIDPDDPNLPARFLLTDLEIPLGLGPMTATAKRLWLL